MSDKEIIHDATIEESFNGRSISETIRDDSGKITGYKFKICIHNEKPLEGRFSREEMDTIYKLYSREGGDLQQRTVSREFGDVYTFEEFKKIKNAFNITKDSSPFAPHIIEERTPDELVELTLQHKENSYLRRLEQDRARLSEVKYKELLKQHYNLQTKIGTFQELLSDIDINIEPIEFIQPIHTNDNTMNVYLSDMHIGADVSGYSIYENIFNFDTATDRMSIIINKILDACITFNVTNIIICNIGDSLDGYNAQTTRGGHSLPQNMDNKDQYKNYIKLMLKLFATLSDSGLFSTIKYVCVEGGNHDGDVGFMVNKSLEACLGVLNPSINVKIFDKFMDYFMVGNNTFILCHGKDAKDMFRNLPLVINDKIENRILEFIRYANIQGNIHFVKGDLHQSATTYAKSFRYKSVGSFFGSSEWIHKNFGNTKAALDYDIIIDDTDIFEGRLLLN